MKKRVILFHYIIKNTAGQVLDSSEGETPMAFLEGAGQVLAAIEKELLCLKVGETARLELPMKLAYGARDARRVMMVPKSELGVDAVKVGDVFRTEDPQHPLPFRVTDVSDVFVTLDGNHPLAGIDLVCDVQLIAIRSATAEEISHGHAHSEGEHHD